MRHLILLAVVLLALTSTAQAQCVGGACLAPGYRYQRPAPTYHYAVVPTYRYVPTYYYAPAYAPQTAAPAPALPRAPKGSGLCPCRCSECICPKVPGLAESDPLAPRVPGEA